MKYLKDLAHGHPQGSVITVTVVMPVGTGASREGGDTFRGGEGRGWESFCLRV